MYNSLVRAGLGIGVLALVSSSLIACTAPGEDTGKITLTYWNQIRDPHTAAAEDAIIADFEKANPDIVIKQTRYDATQQLAPLSKNAFRTSSTPDIMYSEVSTGRDLYNAGLVQNLDEYATQYGWNDRITPEGLAWTTTTEGELFGLGLESELSGVLWNSSLLSQYGLSVPTTVAELDNVCEVSRANGVVPIATGASGAGWIWYFYLGLPIVNVLGVEAEEAFVSHESGAWTDPPIKAALETVFEDAKESECFIPEMTSLENDTAMDMLASGKSMALAPAFTGTLSPTRAANPTDEFAYTPWVAVPGGQGQFHLQGMGSAFFINKKSEHADAAAKFIDYMFTKPVAEKYIETAGHLPPVTGLDLDSLDIDDLLRQGADVLINHSDETGTTVDLVSSDAFNDLMGRGGQEVFGGQKSLDQYLKDLQDQWAKDKP